MTCFTFSSSPPASRVDPPNLLVFLSRKGGSSSRWSLHGGVEPGHQPLTAELGCGAGSASSSGLCWSQPHSALPGRPRPCLNKVGMLQGSAHSWASETGQPEQRWCGRQGRLHPWGEQRAPFEGETPRIMGWFGPGYKHISACVTSFNRG